MKIFKTIFFFVDVINKYGASKNSNGGAFLSENESLNLHCAPMCLKKEWDAVATTSRFDHKSMSTKVSSASVR